MQQHADSNGSAAYQERDAARPVFKINCLHYFPRFVSIASSTASTPATEKYPPIPKNVVLTELENMMQYLLKENFDLNLRQSLGRLFQPMK